MSYLSTARWDRKRLAVVHTSQTTFIMKTKIKIKFLNDLTFEALFNKFIDPSIKRKFNGYLILSAGLFFIFNVLGCFYNIRGYHDLTLLLPILLLPVLAYLSFGKADRIRKAGIREVLAIIREIETTVYNENLGDSDNKDDSHEGMKRVKIKEMIRFLKDNGTYISSAIAQLGLLFDNDAKASRYTFSGGYSKFIASIFAILAFFITLIVGESKLSMDDLKTIAGFVITVMTYCSICYFMAKNILDDLFNSSSKKLKELSALLGEVSLELDKTK